MSKVLISNIKPFNEIWYKNCFYSSFFPIIYKYVGSVSPYLLNELYTYELDENLIINIKTIVLTKFKNLLDDHGISMIMKENESDIVASLISNMKNFQPTIIYVDCFYEQIRSDAFKVEHIPHALLIYGMDTEKQYFNTIEHDYKDSFLYKERCISFDDVKNAYSGFIYRFMSTYNNTFFAYKQLKPPVHNMENVYIQKYIQEMKQYVPQFLKNLDFLEQYRKILTKYDFLNNVDYHINNLNQIIMLKKIELYRNRKIPQVAFGEKKREEIIRCWGSIRAIILKYKFSNKINQTSINVMDKKLMMIYELEKSLLGEYR